MFATITFVLVCVGLTLHGTLDIVPSAGEFMAVLNLSNRDTHESFKYNALVGTEVGSFTRGQVEELIVNLLKRWAFTQETAQGGVILKLANGSKEFTHGRQPVSRQGGA